MTNSKILTTKRIIAYSQELINVEKFKYLGEMTGNNGSKTET